MYESGDHNVECAVCGRVYKRSECRPNSVSKLLVCTNKGCWDPYPEAYKPYRLAGRESAPVKNAQPRQAGTDVDVPATDFDPDSTFPPTIR
jgi:hypothetical protein